MDEALWSKGNPCANNDISESFYDFINPHIDF